MDLILLYFRVKVRECTAYILCVLEACLDRRALRNRWEASAGSSRFWMECYALQLCKSIFYTKLLKLSGSWHDFQLFDHILKVILDLRYQHRCSDNFIFCRLLCRIRECLKQVSPSTTNWHSLVSLVITF